jgi:hypothetical protein
MKRKAQFEDVVSVVEASKRLTAGITPVSMRSVSLWCQNGNLSATKFGGAWAIRVGPDGLPIFKRIPRVIRKAREPKPPREVATAVPPIEAGSEATLRAQIRSLAAGLGKIAATMRGIDLRLTRLEVDLGVAPEKARVRKPPTLFEDLPGERR